MKLDGKKHCTHQKCYDTNSRILFTSFTTNCKDCFLQLYTELLAERNIQIHQIKVFDKICWRRGAKRLHRVRMCFDVNMNCSKLGIDCEEPTHLLKRSKEVPVGLLKVKNQKMIKLHSFICYPKFRGGGEAQYKKQINRRKINLQHSFYKTLDYLNSSSTPPTHSTI